jgi:thiol-disulfide isomerase/thioredoxin
MATKRGLMIGLIVLVVAMLAYMMTLTPPNATSAKNIPDIQLPLMPPAQPTHIAQLRGKVVILDFWATWCEPCRMSMPRLEAIYQKYKSKGLVVIGISEDDASIKDQVVKTAKEIGVTYPLALAGGIEQVGKIFPHDGIPALYLIDKQGILADTEEGFSPDMMDTLDHSIADLLAR